eukprot:CAMPEP_0182801050 /NCGR_PEP_ID=MMETSP0006_2-20121128/2742_1 /TAXON_ID=97485 /ORGANISM="Prymnesium parvum, Strain Texoma1" /LENGTH=61 /DNA_ID=CAMNT_0024926339 /DNA_START=225 /DNA_END=410 /DNA_ORIENTATION=+
MNTGSGKMQGKDPTAVERESVSDRRSRFPAFEVPSANNARDASDFHEPLGTLVKNSSSINP